MPAPPPGEDTTGHDAAGSNGRGKASGGTGTNSTGTSTAAGKFPGVKGGWFTESSLLWPGQRLSLALDVRA
jgi:hypothetical protein